MRRFVTFILSFISFTFCSSSLKALILYWDTNGDLAGSSDIRHTWDTNPATTNWSTSADGTLTTQGWTAGATAVFSAGTNASGSILIDVAPSTSVSAIQFQEGTVEVSGAFYGGSIVDLSTVDVASGITATLNATLTQSSGAINLTKTGAGTLNLIAPNSTTGSTTVSGGTMNINSIANLGSGDITVSGGATLANSGILELNSRTIDVAGSGSTLSSVGYIEFGDVGNTTLNVTSGGEVSSQSSVAFGITGGVTGTGTISGTDSLLSSTSQIFLGYLGTGNLTIADGGRVQVGTILDIANQTGSAGTLNLNSGGTLAIGGTNGIIKSGGTATWNFGGGTLQVSGSSLTTSLGANLTSGTTSTIDTNGLNATLSGTLSGAGGLTKAGTGTLTLSAANTYSGGTTIDEGTLLLGNSASLGAGTASLTLNGGLLNLGGFSPTVGTVVFNGGDITNGSLNNASSFQINEATTVAYDLGGSANLIKTGSNQSILSGTNTYTGTTTVSEGTLFINTPGSLYNGDNSQWSKITVGSGARLSLNVNDSAFEMAEVNTLLDTAIFASETSGLGIHLTDNYILTDDLDLTITSATAATVSLSGSSSISVNGNALTLGTNNQTLNVERTIAGGFGGASGAYNSSGNGSDGAVGGNAGTLSFSQGTIHLAAVSLTGGNGGNGGNSQYHFGGFGGEGGTGGTLQINGGTVNFDSDLTLSGGVGGSGGSSGGSGNWGRPGADGGDSGNFTIFAGTANFASGTGIYLNGGGGGNASTPYFYLYTGGDGGDGGDFTISGGTVNLAEGVVMNLGGGGGGYSSAGNGTTGAAGLLTLSSGTLELPSLEWFNSTSSFYGTLVFSGGTIRTTDSDMSLTLDSTSQFGQALATAGTSTRTLDLAGDLTFTSSINGSGGLTKTGEGTLTLSGDLGNYTGVTTIEAGTLVFARAPGVSGYHIAGDVVNNSILYFDESVGTILFNGDLSGTGSLFVENTRIRVYAQATYTGSTTIAEGSSLYFFEDIPDSPIFQNEGHLVFAPTESETFSGIISGEGSFGIETSISAVTPYVVIFTGDQTYTGATHVNWNTLQLGDGGTSGSLASQSIDLRWEESILSFNRSDDLTYSGTIFGLGSVEKHGAGTLTLTGTNTYSGSTTITDGTLIGASLANFGSGDFFISGGGSLEINNFIALNRDITIDGAGSTFTTQGNNSSDWLYLGSGGASSVSITNGGGLYSSEIYIGYDSTGEISISGTDSTLRSGQFIAVGIEATGTLTIADGAHVYAPKGVYVGNSVGSHGTLNLNEGGVLHLGELPALVGADLGSFGGSATFNFAGGTLLADGDFTSSLNAILSNTSTIDTSTFGAAYTGVLSGEGNLVKAGSSNLTLSGNNTFTGTTTISEGTLTLGHENALAGSTLTSANGLSFGTLTSAHLGGLSGTDNLALNNEASSSAVALNVGGNNGSTTYSGDLSGTGSLTKSGTGTFTLSGDNSYTGSTTVDDGILQLGSATALGNTTTVDVASGAILNLNGHSQNIGDLDGAGAIQLGSAALTTGDNANHALSGVISGTGSLTKTGSGSLTLSGANTYSGGTTVSGGTLAISSDSNLGSGGSSLTIHSGALLNTGGDFRTNRAVTIDGAGSQLYNNGELIVGYNGTGSLSLSNNATASTYNLTLAYTGGTGSVDIGAGSALSVGNLTALGSAASTININSGGTLTTAGISSAGTVNLNSGGVLNSSGTINGGTFNLSGGTLRANGDLSVWSDSNLSTASTFDTNGHTLTVTGDISGSGSLTKIGSGTLVLSENHWYTGGTTIEAGTVSVGSAADLGSGSVTINGGTLSGSGNLSLDRTVLVDSADASLGTTGYLEFGSAGNGSLTLSDGAQITSGSSVAFGVLGGTTGTGLVTGSGSQLNVTTDLFLGYIGTGTLTIADGGVVTTPELQLGTAGGVGSLNLNTGGTLQIGASGISGGTGTANLNLAGGTLETTFSNGVTVPINLASGTDSTINTGANSPILTGTISGEGSLTKTGSGNLYFGMTSNTYTGGTTVSEGTLTAIYAEALPGNVSNNAAITLFSGTYGGTMSGTGSLTKTGTGTLTLSGSNTYSGGTSVTGGTLSIASDANLGDSSGALSVTSGAILATGGDFRTNRAVTLDGVGTQLTNNGELIIGNNGTGSLSLTNSAAASAYNLTLAYTGGTGTVDLSSGASLWVGNVTALDTASSMINLNTGGTLATAGLTGSGTLNLAGGTLRSNGPFISNVGMNLSNASIIDTNGFSTTLSGNLSGAGSLTKSGSGDLILTGTNTFSSGTTVSAGTLILGNGAASGSIAGDIINNTAVIFNRSDDYIFGGVISGSGDFTMDGYILRLSQAQTYTGSTSIGSGGYLVLPAGVDQGLSTSTTVDVASGGNFDISNRSQTVSGLTGAGTVYSFGGSGGVLTVAPATGQSQTFSGVIGGPYANFALVKSGEGTLNLSGSNTYTQGTTINGGVLKANNSSGSAFGTGDVTVVNGGTLGGSGRFSGSLTVDEGGTLAPGNSPGTLESGSTTFEGGGTYHWEIEDAAGSAGTDWDLVIVHGTLTVNATAENPFIILIDGTNNPIDAANFDPYSASGYIFTIIETSGGIAFGSDASIQDSFQIDATAFANPAGGGWSLALSGNNLNLVYSVVPEPGFLGLLAGMAVLLGAGRRRRGAEYRE